MERQHSYRSQVLDHLGLVAGMYEELGIGEVLAQATQQHPDMRLVTAGQAVKAMVLNGLGFVNQPLYLVPQFFQNTPTSRLIAPATAPAHLDDDMRGRVFETLYTYGVTALYRLMAATAAARLGLAPTLAHLESTSFHVDGRDNRDDQPDEQVMQITRSYSREHRPDLHQVMLELIVEPQAGIPVRMTPLSGHSREAQEFGQILRAHMEPWQTTDGMTYLVADSALYRADHLQQFSGTRLQWMTRVPATLSEAPQALAQADPPVMAPLTAGYRSHVWTSSDGGVEQRWVLIDSESRQPQAPRAVDRERRQHSDTDVKAFKKRRRTVFACHADAQQALAAFAQSVQATFLHESTVRPQRRDGTRGRPGQGTPPDQVVYQIEGALASRRTARQVRLDQHSCVILATHEFDAAQLSPQAL